MLISSVELAGSEASKYLAVDSLYVDPLLSTKILNVDAEPVVLHKVTVLIIAVSRQQANKCSPREWSSLYVVLIVVLE